MRIALLGGSGFIGKNLALELSQNHEIHIIDRYIDTPWFSERGFKINQLHCAELSGVIQVLQEYEFDKLIHLVSTINPGSSMITPENGYSLDVVETIKILEHLKNKKTDVVFFSSGGTVYGDKSTLETISEETPLHPISHYGVVKGTLESILLMYNRVYGMKNIVLRLSNPYGEYQNVNGAVGAIAVFMNKIIKGEEIVVVGDGSVVRDYIYISDVRRIVARMFEKESLKYDVYNLGSGHGASVNEIIKLLEKILQKKANVTYAAERKFDVKRNVLNVTRIKEELEITELLNLENGMTKFYNSFLTEVGMVGNEV